MFNVFSYAKIFLILGLPQLLMLFLGTLIYLKYKLFILILLHNGTS
jgi:hypothetical protein